ncbi:MAG: methylenetetrahydrofolate reductase, partial [Paracoccus sp. (in: a-proteobacteria)]
GTSVPQWAEEAFAAAGKAGEAQLALDVCVGLCEQLVEGGVEKLHFYTLNKPELVLKVCAALGVHPNGDLSQVA